MDKLTIEHLAPYIPYGVKVKHLNHKRNYNGLEWGILNGLYPLCAPDGIYWQYTTYNNSTGQNIEYCMPLLRPLSDLTKEIEHNGERFVPMVRLLEMKDRNHFSKDSRLRAYSENVNVKVIDCESKYYSSGPVTIHKVRQAVETTNMGTLVYSFSYDDRFDRFSMRDETRDITLGVGHQLQLFQKLYEWYIDVHQLIPKGLAIDLNTLTTEPIQ